MIEIRELTSADEPGYAACVERDPHAWIYASLAYRDLLQRIVPGRPRYLVALEAERIVGGLPMFEVSAPGAGTLFNSLPWYGSHGGCTLDGTRDAEVRRALIAAYRRRVDAEAPLSATLILTPSEQAHIDEYRAILGPTVEDERIGQVTPLPADGAQLEPQLMDLLLRKTRNLVRKSLRQGFELEVSDGEDAWRFLHATHEANIKAIGGKAKPWAQFAAIRDVLAPSQREVSIAMLKGEPVAALLLLFFRQTVEYFTPVVVETFRAQQPLSYLIYHAMVAAVKRGCVEWNWGGTWKSQTTLHHFKHGWGALDRPYTYLICSADRGARLREHRAQLGELFPFYYAYPYDQLA